MLSVVIPTLNAAASLPRTLAVLVPGAVSGLVGQLIVADGGSNDQTLEIADAAGADIVRAPVGRGRQLAAGAAAARGSWLLFLHADTALDAGWEHAAARFREAAAGQERAACFRFRLDDGRTAARALEWAVAARCRLFALPYGDQGLLIPAPFYRRLGGFRPIPLMEDVDLIRRIGRRRLIVLRHGALTSAERYRRDGYLKRAIRNGLCLSLWFAGVSPERIARLYAR
jgi:rSAM/selenodomain-associated transferase 2